MVLTAAPVQALTHAFELLDQAQLGVCVGLEHALKEFFELSSQCGFEVFTL